MTSELDVFIRVFVFLFGAIVGSFLNVCIVRLPKEQSIVKPRSHCVNCKKTIPWYDNIPLASYLLLQGRCRFCHKNILFRYFFIELLTAFSFLYFYLYFGLSGKLFCYLIFLSGLIVATFVDFEHRIIPDEVSIGGMIIGFILSFIFPELQNIVPTGWLSHTISAGWSLFGIVVGGGAIFLMGTLGDFLFKKETMGGGDVKLLAMIGAFLGWKLAILTFFIAPFFGAIVGIVVKLRTKENIIAYGPFLTLGALISLFWSEPILGWIMRGYGIY